MSDQRAEGLQWVLVRRGHGSPRWFIGGIEPAKAIGGGRCQVLVDPDTMVAELLSEQFVVERGELLVWNRPNDHAEDLARADAGVEPGPPPNQSGVAIGARLGTSGLGAGASIDGEPVSIVDAIEYGMSGPDEQDRREAAAQTSGPDHRREPVAARIDTIEALAGRGLMEDGTDDPEPMVTPEEARRLLLLGNDDDPGSVGGA